MVLSLVQWMVLGMLSLVHPHHVSTTSIEYNPTAKSLEITVELFADDLEKSLVKFSKGKVDVLNKAEYERSSKLINQYISQHLKLEIDDKKTGISFVGFEDEKGNVLAYFEVTDVNSISKLAVNNTLLYDTQKQQVNIVKVKANGKSKTASLKYANTKYVFDLK